MIYCVQNPSSFFITSHSTSTDFQHWRLLGIPTMMGCSYFWYGLWKPKYGPVRQQSFEIETNMWSSRCWILQWKSQRLVAAGCTQKNGVVYRVWPLILPSLEKIVEIKQTSWPVLPSGKRANITNWKIITFHVYQRVVDMCRCPAPCFKRLKYSEDHR